MVTERALATNNRSSRTYCWRDCSLKPFQWEWWSFSMKISVFVSTDSDILLSVAWEGKWEFSTKNTATREAIQLMWWTLNQYIGSIFWSDLFRPVLTGGMVIENKMPFSVHRGTWLLFLGHTWKIANPSFKWNKPNFKAVKSVNFSYPDASFLLLLILHLS